MAVNREEGDPDLVERGLAEVVPAAVVPVAEGAAAG